MIRFLSVLAIVTTVGAAQAEVASAPDEMPPAPPGPVELPQMPQHLPEPVPQQAPQPFPSNSPQPGAGQTPGGWSPYMSQDRPESVPDIPETQPFLLQCRTTNSDVVFLMDPDAGMAQNVSSFPKMTGALFVSESEYYLVFTGTEVPVPVEFVISRYTGRITAVADGAQVLFTGVCRKARVKTLF